MNSLGKINGGLTAGTLVITPDGNRKIEDVKPGDLVLSGFGDSQTRFFQVHKIRKKSYKGPVLNVTALSGSRFSAVPNHVCFADFPGDNLVENVVILSAFFLLGTGDLSHAVFHNRYDWKMEETNDLDLAEKAAFEMSQADGGAQILRFFNFIFCGCFESIPAKELKVGMQLPGVRDRLVEEITITNITEGQYDGLVYDLDIPEVRNFAANGVLVHA
ncbi:MAG TPA: Hint domain-containing protein [Abditibacterium sp.]|jgi:hypothetical protein